MKDYTERLKRAREAHANTDPSLEGLRTLLPDDHLKVRQFLSDLPSSLPDDPISRSEVVGVLASLAKTMPVDRKDEIVEWLNCADFLMYRIRQLADGANEDEGVGKVDTIPERIWVSFNDKSVDLVTIEAHRMEGDVEYTRTDSTEQENRVLDLIYYLRRRKKVMGETMGVDDVILALKDYMDVYPDDDPVEQDGTEQSVSREEAMEAIEDLIQWAGMRDIDRMRDPENSLRRFIEQSGPEDSSGDTQSEEIREFLEEVAAGPYPDSDPDSLLETLSRRAQTLIDQSGGRDV